MKWKRVTPGHLELYAEHVADEPEVAAEIKKAGSKWQVLMWSWGSNDPKPINTRNDWMRYPNAKTAKAAAVAAFKEYLNR